MSDTGTGPRLVMFDLDGTLVDSHAFLTRIMAETFVAEGLKPPPPSAQRHVIGLSLPRALEVLSGQNGETVDRLAARFRTLFHGRIGDGSEDEPLFSGARTALEALQTDPRRLFGIATGKGLLGLERVLTLHGLTEMFVTRQTPDTNPSKPHPQMLQVAMAETGVAPDDTVMIGDTTFDIEMARAAGVHALGVGWGAHDVKLLAEAGAHLIVDDFAALPDAVDRLIGLTHA